MIYARARSRREVRLAHLLLIFGRLRASLDDDDKYEPRCRLGDAIRGSSPRDGFELTSSSSARANELGEMQIPRREKTCSTAANWPHKLTTHLASPNWLPLESGRVSSSLGSSSLTFELPLARSLRLIAQCETERSAAQQNDAKRYDADDILLG